MSDIVKFQGPASSKGLSSLANRWADEAVVDCSVDDDTMINKPQHYTLPRAASDCFSVMQQIGLLNNHCVATAFQYLWRSGLKQQYISDLKKARWFIDKAIEKYEQEQQTATANKERSTVIDFQ